MAIVIANVIGVGVFLKARVMTTALGDPGWVMAAWVAAGLLSLAGALTYAELSAMMPKAGGEFAFLSKGYGRLWGFLFGWTQMLVAKTGSQAAAAVAFGIFLNDLYGGSLSRNVASLPGLHGPVEITLIQVVALGLILSVTLMNLASVAASGRLATLLAGIKLLLILFVSIGAFALGDGSWTHFQETNPSAIVTPQVSFASGFAAAMLAALWAYDGWNSATMVAGEVAHPQRNLPRALIGGTLGVMALYLLVNAAYFYVLTPAEVAGIPAHSSVAKEVVTRFMGAGAAALMTLALLASSLGTIHTSVLTGARVPYAMAREGLWARYFGVVSVGSAIPRRALIFQGLWAAGLALSGSFDNLTDYVVFSSWIFYGMAGATVFILRRREPATQRPYRVWGYPWVPAAFLLTIVWLMFQTLKDGATSALVGLGIVASGVPVYWCFFRKPPSDLPPEEPPLIPPI